MKHKYLVLITTFLLIVFFDSIVTPAVVFRDNFEAKNIIQWEREFCCQHSMNFDSTPKSHNRNSQSSIKFTLNRNDPEINLGKRSEIALTSVPTKSEYIYEFSLYLPTQYTTDPSFEILAQWHGLPDFDWGETWRSPPLALVTRNGQFELERSWDINPITLNENRERAIINLGTYTTEEWIDWKFHVRWSYEADGLIQVWQNNQLVFTHLGANTYNDRQGTYFKIGIYKPDWKYDPQKSLQQTRTVF